MVPTRWKVWDFAHCASYQLTRRRLDTITYGKAMPVADIVRNVGIENLYMTQSMPGMSPQDGTRSVFSLSLS